VLKPVSNDENSDADILIAPGDQFTIEFSAKRFETYPPGSGKSWFAFDLLTGNMLREGEDSEAQVSKVACTLTPIRDGLGLSVEIDMPSAGKTETVLIETSDPQVWVAETDSSRSGGRLNARTELVHVSGQAFALDRSGLRFTVLGSDHAVDIHGCTSP